MESYLANDYPAVKPELDQTDRQIRIDAVKEWIARIKPK